MQRRLAHRNKGPAPNIGLLPVILVVPREQVGSHLFLGKNGRKSTAELYAVAGVGSGS